VFGQIVALIQPLANRFLKNDGKHGLLASWFSNYLLNFLFNYFFLKWFDLFSVAYLREFGKSPNQF
jgi:hypothetical protein